MDFVRTLMDVNVIQDGQEVFVIAVSIKKYTFTLVSRISVQGGILIQILKRVQRENWQF